MEFEWDPAKSAANVKDRGLPFDVGAGIFDGPVIEWEDTRRDYGERRFIAIGAVRSRVLVVMYTWRGGRRRLISVRFANGRERRAYRQTYPG